MTFGGRLHSVEDNFWWKMTFGGKQPSVEDDLRWKTTFSGKNLWWKTTFGGKWPLVEDNLWWKTTFGGRQPSVEDDLRWILACCRLRFAAFLFLSFQSEFSKLYFSTFTLLTHVTYMFEYVNNEKLLKNIPGYPSMLLSGAPCVVLARWSCLGGMRW